MTLALLLAGAFAVGVLFGVVVANEVRIARRVRARGGQLDFTGAEWTRAVAERADLLGPKLADVVVLDWDDPR